MNQSESIANLAQALAKAQGSMTAAKKTASNPFFKSTYADLAAIVEAIKIPLSSNGLAFAQATDIDDGNGVVIETMLMHESGEWLSSRLRMVPTKQDPQGVGSCITYARRYGLQALLGVPADDDDGNASTGADREVEVRNAIQETAKDRFDPRTPRKTQVPPANDPNPDILPEDPAAMQDAFDTRVTSMPRPAWADDPAQMAQKGVQLAQNLRTNGMKDKDRKQLYATLTGLDSSKDMAAEQLAVLFANSGTQGTKRLLGLLAWTESQDQLEVV